MKICVFQGTFNPIHNAHLKMAKFVKDNYNFDKIIFIPAFKPPHKKYDINMAEHRLNMVKLAISNYDGFEVSDIEYKSNNVSYTYLTIKKLYEIYDVDDKIYFIIGTDAYNNIDSWYEAEKLKKIIKFIVFSRGEKLKDNDCIVETMPFNDISSTAIRQNIKENKDITNLVPQAVKEYIENNGLYKNE